MIKARSTACLSLVLFASLELMARPTASLNGSWCYPETHSRIEITGSQGVIVDSHEAALVGVALFRSLHALKKEAFAGEMFSPDRRRYYAAEFTVFPSELKVVARSGIFSRRFTFVRCDP